MTSSIQATTTPRGEGTAGARTAPARAAGAPATRSFDRVFGEAIDERPGRREVEDEREADAGGEPEAAGADDASEAGDESARAESGEAREQTEEPDGDEAGAVAPEAAITATPGVRVSADGIRHEITHAAEIDLASLNAGELSTRGAKSELAEAPERRVSVPGRADSGERRGGERAARSDSSSAKPAQRASGETQSAGAEPARAEASATPGATAAGTAAGAMTGAANAANSVSAGATNAPAGASTAAGTVTATASAAVGGVSAASGSGGTGNAGANATGDQGVLSRLETLGARTAATKGTSASPRHPALAQVQRGLAQVLKEGGGTVTLRLNPRSLGEVRVEVTVKEGAASARFEASSDSARRLLKDNLTTLREALEAKGVRVERLSVELRPGEKPTESADGHRTGRDAGPSQRGDGSPEGFDARSETGAEGGARGDARDARWTASAGTRAGGTHDAERQSDGGPVPDRSGTDRGVWVGLDMMA